MANVFPVDKQSAIVSSLCEGSSIRSIERVTGVHRDAIMLLGVKIGQGCTALMDAKMRNLECTRLAMDEFWGYTGKKDKHVRPGDDPQFGNAWAFCAIDADTKLVSFQGQTVWDGTVEVSHIKGHPQTDRVYGWIHATGDPANPKRHVTVLHIPPVVSPKTAVQAAIVQEFKDRAKVN